MELFNLSIRAAHDLISSKQVSSLELTTATLDQLRTRYGRQVVFFGCVQESRDQAPMRISFTHIPDLSLEQD